MDSSIGIEEAAASAGALRDVFADQATIQQDTVEFVAMLEEGMGMLASTARAIDMMMKMGLPDKKKYPVLLCKHKKCQQDSVWISKKLWKIYQVEEIMIFARGSAKALAEGAVQQEEWEQA